MNNNEWLGAVWQKIDSVTAGMTDDDPICELLWEAAQEIEELRSTIAAIYETISDYKCLM